MPTTMATATKTCRILYYGPPGCGKRENLAQIQASLPPEHRLAVATSDPSRQIAFMLKNGNQGDWQVFVQAVDAGFEEGIAEKSLPFDGIVFVCDSRSGGLDTGLSAMEGLKTYLDQFRMDIMSMPMVLQYNQRNGENVLPVDRLESLLNPWGLLSFPAASAKGEGVRETLKAVLSQTISHILQRDKQPETAGDEGLAIDPNPPLPGNNYGEVSEPAARAQTPPPADPAPASPPPAAPSPSPTPRESAPRTENRHKAALVIPVQVPRSALNDDGTGRIILEVQVVDD